MPIPACHICGPVSRYSFTVAPVQLTTLLPYSYSVHQIFVLCCRTSWNSQTAQQKFIFSHEPYVNKQIYPI